jgi:hypothetical protein
LPWGNSARFRYILLFRQSDAMRTGEVTGLFFS